MVAVVSAACIVAVVTDVRTRKIPNWLSFGLAAVGIAYSAFGGWHVLALSLLAYVVVFAAGAVLFSMGWLGGGDVKLLAAVASFVGFPDALLLTAYTGIAGGLLAFSWLAAERIRSRRTLAEVKASKLPYAIAILTGFAVLVAGELWLPILRLQL